MHPHLTNDIHVLCARQGEQGAEVRAMYWMHSETDQNRRVQVRKLVLVFGSASRVSQQSLLSSAEKVMSPQANVCKIQTNLIPTVKKLTEGEMLYRGRR